MLHCVATWAGVDGIALLQRTLGGSGYDIACAGSDSPIVYHLNGGKPHWEQISFMPPFAEHIYFVYTGQKQLSSKGIKYYRENATRIQDCVGWLNRLTESMLQCQSLDKMNQIIAEHENIIAEELKLPKAKD